MRVAAFILGGIMLMIFIFKAVSQKKRGIDTIVMGKSGKEKTARITEIFLSLFMLATIAGSVISVIIVKSVFPLPARIFGCILCTAADVILAVAVICMRDSWRAGIAENEDTELVTDGIYKFSRNPAFAAFDLMFLGILIMFFNVPLAVVVVMTVIALHLQILNEEKYLSVKFGEEYQSYKSSVGRYFIF